MRRKRKSFLYFINQFDTMDNRRSLNLSPEATTDYKKTWSILDSIREASGLARSYVRTGESVPAELVTKIADDVDALVKALPKEEKRSLASLYLGVIFGALMGVLGNFIVSFSFQPLSVPNVVGLTGSLISFLAITIIFGLQVRKYSIQKA